MFVYIVIWIVIAVVVGLIAHSRGRSFIGWAIYGLLIWPVAIVHLLCIGRTERGLERKARAEGRTRCPYCSEHIRREARVCPYCRKEIGRGGPGSAGAHAGRTYRGLTGYPGARD